LSKRRFKFNRGLLDLVTTSLLPPRDFFVFSR
jgi:hypothetical protein